MNPTTAEREAVTADIRNIAAYLEEHLGQRLTAYLSGLDDSAPVGLWSTGKAEPHELDITRLRHAYQAAWLLVDSYDSETARAWFFGSNTGLDDEAPAYILRHATRQNDLTQIIPAARAFVETAG